MSAVNVAPPRFDDPARFGRVAVLMGGIAQFVHEAAIALGLWPHQRSPWRDGVLHRGSRRQGLVLDDDALGRVQTRRIGIKPAKSFGPVIAQIGQHVQRGKGWRKVTRGIKLIAEHNGS